jgi:[CysO sulfur-carrier protein]-thiocarboxylate-dependent cysteine synthase
MKHSSILGLIGNTPLVEVPRLSPDPSIHLWVKLEGQNPTGSVKDRIALEMVQAAEASGELTGDKILLEPTSGNTGIALAMVASIRGYRFTAVMPDNASAERVQLLRAFGADIVFSEGAKGTNGSVAMAQEMAEDDRYLMLFQYDNQANVDAHYKGTAQEIIDDLPGVKAFVAGLGTGGTLMGVARYLRRAKPGVRIVAAEPIPGENVQGLRSIEDGFVPEIFDPALLDARYVVSNRDALAMTRELLAREGIFAGPSSGAILLVAARVAGEMESGTIVALLPDGGWKYLSAGAYSTPLDDLEDELEGGVAWW